MKVVVDLIAYCRQSLASYKIPRRVEFSDAEPQSGSGKILKKILRERFSANQQRAVDGLGREFLWRFSRLASLS